MAPFTVGLYSAWVPYDTMHGGVNYSLVIPPFSSSSSSSFKIIILIPVGMYNAVPVATMGGGSKTVGRKKRDW